jgi:tRNA G18 (ribose-2'-O)-methylase SpoU
MRWCKMLQKNKTELREGKPSRQEYGTVQKHPIVVVLDNLNSAFNIGVIFRLAEALLLEKVYLCGDCPLPDSRKFQTTAKRSEKWIAWEHKSDTKDTVMELKNEGYKIVSAELSHNSIPYTEAIYEYPTAFIFGNEKKGVSEDILELSDTVVHLPIYGMANSLNVSSCASVMLYDAIVALRS